MEKKKLVKLAIIRENDEKPCPFGLFIPDGCLMAGCLVDNMTPIEADADNKQIVEELPEEDKKTIMEANNRVLLLSKEPKIKCKYANYVFKSNEKDSEAKVECSFGDNAAGLGGAVNWNASQGLSNYLGISFYSLPIGFYNQDLTYQEGFSNFVNRYFASEDEPELKKEAEDKNKK